MPHNFAFHTIRRRELARLLVAQHAQNAVRLRKSVQKQFKNCTEHHTFPVQLYADKERRRK